MPAAERVVAIGDLHGDFEKTRRAFRLGGLTDDMDRWIGGKAVCVQVKKFFFALLPVVYIVLVALKHYITDPHMSIFLYNKKIHLVHQVSVLQLMILCMGLTLLAGNCSCSICKCKFNNVLLEKIPFCSSVHMYFMH